VCPPPLWQGRAELAFTSFGKQIKPSPARGRKLRKSPPTGLRMRPDDVPWRGYQNFSSAGGGKLVRDDEGNPITVRRYSDNLLLALLKAKRPPRRERSVRFQLPALCDGPGCLDSFRGGIS
jgi:hypothetical protein